MSKWRPAEHDPVARIVVDVPLPHLDRPFDYLVPAALADQVQPGCRVRVRFSGKLADGIVLSRAAKSDHPGRLSFVERLISPEPALSDEVAQLARAVADRWAGTLPDVLRLALPPRHARTEANRTQSESLPIGPAKASGWSRYTAGPAWLRALDAGRAARAVWSALPGEDWPSRIAETAQTVAHHGRGVVIVVPDYRDLTRLDIALSKILGPRRHVCLSADLGPAERYRRWLLVRRGDIRVVAGVRSAIFAPVENVGLIVVWDDGDDLHLEPRAPYPHTRDVAVLRAHLSGAALLIAGFARTAEAHQLQQSGWAHSISAPRENARAAAPRILPMGTEEELDRDPHARTARVPAMAWQAAQRALSEGTPVLVQVPRKGYVPALSCAQCRSSARCLRCQGPLAAAPHAVPTCRWCGALAGGWRCPECDGDRFRARVIGATRTAEELGKAFSGTPLYLSGGQRVINHIPAGPAVVVATPGAEPSAEQGYGAALLLDGWALLGRADVRASEEALRRWMNAAALVRPASSGGTVIVGADSGLSVVQALVRWDPVGHAEREYAERVELRFPPAFRCAALTGSNAALSEVIAAARLPDPAELLGPVPISSAEEEDEAPERLLIRVPREDGQALAAALRAVTATRSARKAPDLVRVVLDPHELV